MTKVTYLLGAGASYHAVPIVGEMRERANIFAKAFYSPYRHSGKQFMQFNGIDEERWNKSRAYQNIENLLLALKKIKEQGGNRLSPYREDLKWFANEISKHSSVDTLAKKLYLKEKEGNRQSAKDLKKLKFMLASYLTIEQKLNGQDQRYDKFFASILGEGISELPKNISILTWNYDYQFELAYSDYTDEPSLSANLLSLNIVTKRTYKDHNDISDSDFSIYKLNGTSGVIAKQEKKFERPLIDNFGDLELLNIIEKLVEMHKEFSENSWIGLTGDELSMSFAWEDDNTISEIGLNMGNIMNPTTDLIIIGYSFPNFNSRIDKLLLSSLSSAKMGNLRNIFIQDKNPGAVISAIKAIEPSLKPKIRTHPSDNLSEFYIPRNLLY